MRNLLEEFHCKDHGLRQPTILGVREHVFTGRYCCCYPCLGLVTIIRPVTLHPKALCFQMEMRFINYAAFYSKIGWLFVVNFLLVCFVVCLRWRCSCQCRRAALWHWVKGCWPAPSSEFSPSFLLEYVNGLLNNPDVSVGSSAVFRSIWLQGFVPPETNLWFLTNNSLHFYDTLPWLFGRLEDV